MLEKQESYSKIEVLESGVVQLRKTTKVLDDGEIISQSHHRSIVKPNDDISYLPKAFKTFATLTGLTIFAQTLTLTQNNELEN